MAGPKPIPPTVTVEPWAGGDTREVSRHPAFGNIMVSRPQGSIGVLHGSELNHSSCIKLTISNAELQRGLSNDWHHAKGMIVELEMSEAQWATFISSVGNGGGVPCTLRHKPEDGYALQWVPPIERHETGHEKFSREMKEAVKKRGENMKAAVAQLRAAVEGGKPGIKDLREILRNLELNLDYLPGTAAFVMDCLQETVEKETEAAKAEIEAFLTGLAHRTGIEALKGVQAPALMAPKKESKA